MATFTLSGSGTHAITAGTGALHVHVTTLPTIRGAGRAEPTNYYDLGLLRLGDGTYWWPSIPIDAEFQLLGCPQGTLEIAYALFNGTQLSVVEVAGANPLAGSRALEDLSDVLIASVADGEVLKWNASAGKWENGGSAGGGLYSAYLCYEDRKTQNTPGGTATSGAWRTRDLNTEVADSGNHGSVAANQITLDGGTYDCLISCPAEYVRHHVARLQNITAGTTLLPGTTEQSYTTVSFITRSVIAGTFNLAVASVLEIQHIVESTNATNGWGSPSNLAGEVYTVAQFWRRS